MNESSSTHLPPSATRENLWLEREQPVLDALKTELADCGLFVDVGANIGDYTYLANQYMQNAAVICIEPNVDLNPVLQETINTAKSEYSHNNSFQIINKVISDSTGTIDFFVESNPTLSGINNRSNHADRRTLESIPLDDLYQGGVKTFIKMDIEGAEYQAVKSGKQFLHSNTTKFLIELHAWGDKSIRKYPLNVATLFLTHGYRIRKVDPTYMYGSHYIFEKGTYLQRTASYVFYFPLFLAQYVLYRFFDKTAPKLVGFLRRFK